MKRFIIFFLLNEKRAGIPIIVIFCAIIDGGIKEVFADLSEAIHIPGPAAGLFLDKPVYLLCSQ
jgi:hypothetical protein